MVWKLVVSACRVGEMAFQRLHPAKMPFLPLLEKLAERLVLYGVLSLLNRICKAQ
jgi:hypothetical protein